MNTDPVNKAVYGSGGSKGGTREVPNPRGPNSFNFMQFLRKFGKIVCWRPPRGVGAPFSGKSWIRHCMGHQQVIHYQNAL